LVISGILFHTAPIVKRKLKTPETFNACLFSDRTWLCSFKIVLILSSEGKNAVTNF